jgi:hypothetical protein
MNGHWIDANGRFTYISPEFGAVCTVHTFNDGWMLSISPSVRSRLSLDVFFNNIFPTIEEAKETFEGLITVYKIKENDDEC